MERKERNNKWWAHHSKNLKAKKRKKKKGFLPFTNQKGYFWEENPGIVKEQFFLGDCFSIKEGERVEREAQDGYQSKKKELKYRSNWY